MKKKKNESDNKDISCSLETEINEVEGAVNFFLILTYFISLNGQKIEMLKNWKKLYKKQKKKCENLETEIDGVEGALNSS